jgi:hypothetical protein
MVDNIKKPIKEMSKDELREYKRNKAKIYNDKPKIKCETCEREYKPCSEKAHLNSIYHKYHTILIE